MNCEGFRKLDSSILFLLFVDVIRGGHDFWEKDIGNIKCYMVTM